MCIKQVVVTFVAGAAFALLVVAAWFWLNSPDDGDSRWRFVVAISAVLGVGGLLYAGQIRVRREIRDLASLVESACALDRIQSRLGPQLAAVPPPGHMGDRGGDTRSGVNGHERL